MYKIIILNVRDAPILVLNTVRYQVKTGHLYQRISSTQKSDTKSLVEHIRNQNKVSRDFDFCIFGT